MQQYSIEFFDRSFNFVYRDTAVNLTIDEDYLSLAQNSVEIGPTTDIKFGHFIRIQSDNREFFGVVVEASPGKYKTTIRYKSFLSLFDEDILFDTNYQLKRVDAVVNGVSTKVNQYSLEQVLQFYIEAEYKNNSDTLQNLPIIVSTASSTKPWGFNIKSDVEDQHQAIIGLYQVLIVNSMKQYGVALNISPDYERKVVYITISTNKSVVDIDGSLDNLVVKTLKLNDRPSGTNKLVVYDASDLSRSPIIFYVYTNREWGVDNTDRITPVSKDLAIATPDPEIEDPVEAFAIAALDIGYSQLSGLTWDNLIELEVIPNDPLIKPMQLEFGQMISLWYKGDQYSSILTGRNIGPDVITLTFGSERIKFTKRRKV